MYVIFSTQDQAFLKKGSFTFVLLNYFAVSFSTLDAFTVFLFTALLQCGDCGKNLYNVKIEVISADVHFSVSDF